VGDDTVERKDRYFHSAESEDGPDTVRILPDDAPSSNEEWRVEKHPVQRGTLYAPASTPAPSTKPSPTPDEDTTPAENLALQPYDSRPLQSTTRKPKSAITETSPAVSHIHKGPSACAIIAATVGVLLISCALLTFATFKGGLDGLGKLAGIFPGMGILTTPTVTIDTSRPTVIDQVRALSKLETIHYQLEKVVSGKSSGPLPDFLTSDKILLVAHGEVVAGVDLGKVTANDITVLSDTVTIRMPRPEVLYSKLDNDKTYVYDRQTGVFSRPDPNLETQIRQAAEKDILDTALEDGILDKAGTNAQEVIRTLLKGLGYKDVRFTQGP
jgi:hypothetical protein